MAFREHMKSLRQRRNMSVSELSRKIGISKPALYKIERGITDVNLSRIVQIAEVLQVPLSCFFDDKTTVKQDDELYILTKRLTQKEHEIKALESKIENLSDLLRQLRSSGGDCVISDNA